MKNMNAITIERKYTFKQTEKKQKKIIEKLELQQIQVSTVCYKDDEFPTYVTYMKNCKGQLITRGNGKGEGKQSTLSSSFEGLEHLCCEPYFMEHCLKWKNVKLIPFKRIKKGMSIFFSENLMYENFPDTVSEKMASMRFTEYGTNRKIRIPLFMVGPSYPYPCVSEREAAYVNSVYWKTEGGYKLNVVKGENLRIYPLFEDSRKYVSTVGCAAGIDYEDTFLHAINEVIERDTTSEFLLQTVFNKAYAHYSIIDSETLDENNKRIYGLLRDNYGINVVIVDITGTIGIPTVMVCDRENRFGGRILLTGYGTSLSLAYAIERALLEYKQTIDLVLYDKTLPQDGDKAYDEYMAKEIPDFFKTLFFYDYKQVLINLPKKTYTELKYKYTIPVAFNVNSMLKHTVSIIHKKGYNILSTKMTVGRGIGKLLFVKVFIPQMCDITDPGTLRFPSEFMLKRIGCEG